MVPFGMVQLRPDTQIRPRQQAYGWAAGYRYEDRTIVGFSHTHFSGTGHSDLGDVLVMPVAGAVQLEPGDPEHPGSGYRSRFSHASERAEPGYYAVTLEDYGDPRRAHRDRARRAAPLRLPGGRPAHLLIDLRTSIYDYPGKVLWSRLRLRGDGTVTGFRETRGWAPGRQLYFAMRFSRPISGHELREHREASCPTRASRRRRRSDARARAQLEGRQLVGVFDFAAAGQRAAGEGGDLAGQRGERDRQPRGRAAGLGLRRRARRGARGLERGARGGSRSRRPRRCAAASTPRSTTRCWRRACPWTWTAATAGPTTRCTSAHGFTYYSTFSLWDTYRALHPLLTLIQPAQRTADVVNSLLAAQQDSPYGMLPVWAFQGHETWCMIGYHAVAVIADAYLKGIRGYDAERCAGRPWSRPPPTVPTAASAQYMQLGYVPIDEEGEAASKTLEYAFDDWTIARMAQAMGQRASSPRSSCSRAANWRNAFDPHRLHARAHAVTAPSARRSIRPRAATAPTTPRATPGSTPGTCRRTWRGLPRAHGGATRLLAQLDQVFDAKIDPKLFAHMEDITGLIG